PLRPTRTQRTTRRPRQPRFSPNGRTQGARHGAGPPVTGAVGRASGDRFGADSWRPRWARGRASAHRRATPEQWKEATPSKPVRPLLDEQLGRELGTEIDQLARALDRR